MKTRIFIVIALVVTIVSCQKQSSTDQEINGYQALSPQIEIVVSYPDSIVHARMAYWDFDKIDNLSRFFDSLSIHHPYLYWEDEDYFDEELSSCIKQIDDYRNGKKRFYPDTLVSQCIKHLGFNLAMVDNHKDGLIDLVYIEWFMMCAAYYSPDITYLVDAQSPDHRAGFNNVSTHYNQAPWWPYLFFKRSKGYEVVGIGDYKKVASLFQLSDQEGRTYYLFSDNDYYSFNHWLYGVKNADEIYKIAECSALPAECEEGECFYFDVKTLVWKYVKRDSQTQKMIAIGTNPAMVLVLDGEQSRFVPAPNE